MTTVPNQKMILIYSSHFIYHKLFICITVILICKKINVCMYMCMCVLKKCVNETPVAPLGKGLYKKYRISPMLVKNPQFLGSLTLLTFRDGGRGSFRVVGRIGGKGSGFGVEVVRIKKNKSLATSRRRVLLVKLKIIINYCKDIEVTFN